MSGTPSGHLVDAYTPHTNQYHHGVMIPGISAPQTPFTTFGLQSQSISEETAKNIASLQAKLNKKLGPEYISQRPGPGGPKVTYVEGWKVINLANEVFGFNGWSSSIVSLSTDFADYFEETKKYCIGVSAIVRVTLRDGVYHEDIGYGMLDNTKSKGAGLEKCKKEAVTDGLKRALRNFGNVLGNCLYDKAYTAEVVKIKVEQPKFNTNELHRRPEFEDVKPYVPTIPPLKPQAKLSDPPNNYTTPTRGPMQENCAERQNSSNLRAEIRPTPSTSSTGSRNPQISFKSPHPPAQPITPAATPMNNPLRQLQQNKRVSFSSDMAPQPERATSLSSSKMPTNDADFDSDDGFGLNDDEFLALADLAADIGRPIEEDDVGRPINQEEVSLTTTHEPKKIETHKRVSESQQPSTNDAKKLTMVTSREEVIAAALQAQEDHTAIGKANSEPKTTILPPPTVTSTSRQALPQPRQAPISTAVSTTSSGSTSSAHAVRQPHAAPSMAQRCYQNYMKQHHRNEIKTLTDQKHEKTRPKNSPIPSMGGGFNISSVVNTTSSSSSWTGVKRPAEAMSAGLGLATQVRVPTSLKGGRPGLGLQQAASALRHVDLGGAVDITDREDVKRVKL